jgi:hypothetical protein
MACSGGAVACGGDGRKTHRRCSISSYGQPFRVRFGPGEIGEIGERREPHQGLVDDDGTAEFARVGHRRMGSRARVEDGVPASVWQGKEGPQARDPRAGGAGGEGGCEEAKEVLTDDEKRRLAGNGVAADLPSGGACGGKEREWGLEWVKGQPQGLSGRFYRAMRERGGDGQSNGHQWPKGVPAALLPSRGGRLTWGNGRN